MTVQLGSLEGRVGGWMMRSVARLMGWRLGARRRVHTGSEVSIPYLVIDRGHPETLVNLPGFSDEKESFLLMASKLVHRFNVVLLDTVGFGETERDPDREHTLENHTRWISELLVDLNLGPVWLMGNSLGGAIASGVACEHPELVARCLPVGPAGYTHSTSNPIYDEIARGESPFSVSNDREYRRFIQRLFHGERRPIPFISAHLREKMIREREWYEKLIGELTAEMDFQADHPEESGLSFNRRMAGSPVPFHFIWGESDSFFDARIMEELKVMYPEIGTTLIRHCGHCPHLESPSAQAKAVLSLGPV